MPNDLLIADQRKVRPYDLDWNNHINNIVLVRYVMEAIKRDGVEDEDISKILVHFKNELTLHEVANVLQTKKENSYFSILKELNTERDIVLCKVSLK